MKKVYAFGLALLCTAGIAACGNNGSSGPSFAGTITDSAAAALGSNGAEFAGTMVSTFDFGSPAIELSAQASPEAVAALNHAFRMAGVPRRFTSKALGAPTFRSSSVLECTPKFSGDTTDTDGDGILNNATMSCDSTIVHGDTTVLIHELVHEADIDALYGFNASAEVVEKETIGSDVLLDLEETASDNASFATTGAQDHLNITFKDGATVGGNTTGLGFHEQWDATFTPTSTPLALASPLPDGAISFTGSFYVLNLADAIENFNFNMETTTALAYSAACGSAPKFTGGVIKGLFNGQDNVGFSVTFTGCGVDPTVVGHGNATI